MSLSAKKRRANKKAFLKSMDRFQVKSFNQSHYYVEMPSTRVDFWPTTGKWFVLKENRYGQGFPELLSTLTLLKDQKKSPRVVLKVKPSIHPTSDARHRQRKIMAHFGMDFS